MQRGRIAGSLLCAGIFIIVGTACAAGEGTSGNGSATEMAQQNNSRGEENMRKSEITAEQEALLIKISVNEERIRDGKLYDWQEEVLRQYDYALEYLQGKYPSHSFVMIDCEPKNKLNSYTTFWFQADGEEKTYELYLNINENEEYTCEDNYYGNLFEEPYAMELQVRIQKEVSECVSVVSRMTSVKGLEFSENLEVSDILDGKYMVTNSTDIYVDGTRKEAGQLIEAVHKVIVENKIYGSYTVYVLENLPEELKSAKEIAEYVRADSQQAVKAEESFQQFDVEVDS